MIFSNSFFSLSYFGEVTSGRSHFGSRHKSARLTIWNVLRGAACGLAGRGFRRRRGLSVGVAGPPHGSGLLCPAEYHADERFRITQRCRGAHELDDAFREIFRLGAPSTAAKDVQLRIQVPGRDLRPLDYEQRFRDLPIPPRELEVQL